MRHLDHVLPHAEGGETSLANGQGLCARCNHAKQAPGWRQKVTEIDGRHGVETITPTGHTHVSVAPAPPEPVRDAAPGWTPAVGMGSPGSGRVPRSRYSIGCHTARPSGAILYLPRRRPGPKQRISGPARRPDLSWAHAA